MTTEASEKAKTETLTIGVGGMTCASCVSRVERALKKVPGVDGAAVNLATEKATVSFDPASAEVETLLGAIEDAGYEPRREVLMFDAQGDAPLDVTALQRSMTGVSGVIAVNVNPESRRVSITFPEGALDARELCRAAATEGIALVERKPETAAGADAERGRQQRLLAAKWIAAGLAGVAMMLAGFEPVFDQLMRVMSVQDLLVLMFIIGLPIQVWAGCSSTKAPGRRPVTGPPI